MKPILKYPGAKWRLADWIIEHMPPHRAYVEPYFGSGAVFFNKQPCRIETLNDLDGLVVRFFRTCRERPDELARAIGLTPFSREEYLLCNFPDDAIDDVEASRQFMVRVWMAFGSRLRNKTGWRHSTGKGPDGGPSNPKLWARLPDVIMQAGERLLQAQIECKPALDVIRDYNDSEIMIYVDPPYPMGTRTLNGNQYRYEMTDADHEELLSTLNSHKGMILLSGYDCPMYREMLKGWRMETIITTAEKAAIRTECLWMNPFAVEMNGQIIMEGCR